MLRKLREAQENEEGFTLIELLVVVIIIGILAAIAIPVFLNQREKAWDTAAKATLRSVAVAQESYFTENGNYTGTVGDLTNYGYPAAGDITVAIVGTPGTAFCAESKHTSGTNIFKVENGGAQPEQGECNTNGTVG